MREEFLPHEAKAIISIPLSNLGTKDKLIWSATSNGCYSTKSTYHLLSMEAVVSEPGPSIPKAHNQFWRQLWSLNVLNKIRHFQWRASNDSLPIKKNLQKRNISLESTYEHCGDNTEDTIHALWGCPIVKGTWWELEQCRTFLWEKFKCTKQSANGIVICVHRMEYMAQSECKEVWDSDNAYGNDLY